MIGKLHFGNDQSNEQEIYRQYRMINMKPFSGILVLKKFQLNRAMMTTGSQYGYIKS
jgi:hypothetical protein